MNSLISASTDQSKSSSKSIFFLLVAISIVALICTFFISNSSFDFVSKTTAFLSTVGVYSLVVIWLYFRVPADEETGIEKEKEVSVSNRVFSPKVEEKLLVFDEANNFFSASLRADDMFRLVASRIAEIVEYKACVLFLSEETSLKATFAYGENSRVITKNTIDNDKGLAGRSFLSGEIERDRDLSLDREVLPEEALKGLNSAIAVPLTRGEEIFGVMVLYAAEEDGFGGNTDMLLQATAERVSPLLLSSFSFEQNISNAMTDTLTNLPNERAFYLVLENQIAEAQRSREQRPLTILAVDIKDFADFNRRFGYSTGDNLLAFASGVIKDQLRKMDFLSRSMNDEFWVVLPTASEDITKKIRERIENAFSNKHFKLADDKKHFVKLNFGAATFLKDGETTNQLLQRALLRKKQTKSKKENTVLMFPKEYVN